MHSQLQANQGVACESCSALFSPATKASTMVSCLDVVKHNIASATCHCPFPETAEMLFLHFVCRVRFFLLHKAHVLSQHQVDFLTVWSLKRSEAWGGEKESVACEPPIETRRRMGFCSFLHAFALALTIFLHGRAPFLHCFPLVEANCFSA